MKRTEKIREKKKNERRKKRNKIQHFTVFSNFFQIYWILKYAVSEKKRVKTAFL